MKIIFIYNKKDQLTDAIVINSVEEVPDKCRHLQERPDYIKVYDSITGQITRYNMDTPLIEQHEAKETNKATNQN